MDYHIGNGHIGWVGCCRATGFHHQLPDVSREQALQCSPPFQHPADKSAYCSTSGVRRAAAAYLLGLVLHVPGSVAGGALSLLPPVLGGALGLLALAAQLVRARAEGVLCTLLQAAAPCTSATACAHTRRQYHARSNLHTTATIGIKRMY
jgi:hypothetical protein